MPRTSRFDGRFAASVALRYWSADPAQWSVDHGVFVVRIGGQRFENTGVHLLPIAKPFGQVPPGNARALAVENRFDEQAVTLRGYTNVTFSTWKQVLDAVPLVIT